MPTNLASVLSEFPTRARSSFSPADQTDTFANSVDQDKYTYFSEIGTVKMDRPCYQNA